MPGLAEISVEGQELVRGISERVKALPRATIQLIGSFDLLGSSEYAIALLYRRLHEVEDALLKAGVHPSQIRKISRMNANPPAAEADRHSDVELRVVPVP
ncbi:MAG: hypothetical protein JSR19_12230 [Proteobacteria bacterium]|nr:hypothetical protein [Pseudomonadota bacterium]HQR03328.1 hypothetical protein [Rhodocyclaceae bacterium]